ncbi:MAG: dienelactone hydrolase family protein, partial [Pseudomonadales bacterium]
MSRRWDTLEVDGTPMRCYLTLPDDARGLGTTAGVLVCMHAPGVDDFILGICDRLANAGFAAIAPDLYHRQTEPQDNPLKRM